MLSLRKLLDTCGQEDAEKIIVIETLYSMDGDMCPLEDVLDMAAQYGAMVIVDEAHSTGWYGSRGEGMVTSLGLTQHPALLGMLRTFKAFIPHMS
jgi:8-amino-7-oxononanoate synthase